jgi:hypothetical protein
VPQHDNKDLAPFTFFVSLRETLLCLLCFVV